MVFTAREALFAISPNHTFNFQDMAAVTAGLALFLGSEGIEHCYKEVKEKFGGRMKDYVQAHWQDIEARVTEMQNDRRMQDFFKHFGPSAENLSRMR